MVNPIQCNRQTTTKGLITMFDKIIKSDEVKFNELEKKVFRFVRKGDGSEFPPNFQRRKNKFK